MKISAGLYHHSTARLACLGLVVFFYIAGCGVAPEEDSSLKETQLELSVQQTLLAQQKGLDSTATVEAQQANETLLSAPTTQAPPTATLPPTQGPDPGQLATQAAQQTGQAGQALAMTPTPVDMEALMKSAQILLYEDMINNLDTNRYVKDTLNAMGLRYKDDGSAKGWLKTDLLGGAPNGQPWDLVIIAAESKSGVQGEFFQFVMDALDRGSSVILEVWYLDQTYTGTANSLLARCGIEFQSDWSKVPPSRMVMFPLDATHPVLQEPNTGLTFTDTTSYWWDENGEIPYDIGDLVRASYSGDARILAGTMASETASYGTLTVCVDNRLILQTFSSHQLTFNAMRPVWENYIYNALKARFLGTE